MIISQQFTIDKQARTIAFLVRAERRARKGAAPPKREPIVFLANGESMTADKAYCKKLIDHAMYSYIQAGVTRGEYEFTLA